jgi:zinc transport system substrate-binding protein
MHIVLRKNSINVRWLIALAILLLCLTSNAYGALNVVVTLKPIHSLMAALMQGVGEPRLLLNDAQSPHNMSLKPSQVRLLGEADLIIWIGPELEPALSQLMEGRTHQAKVIGLIETPDLQLLPIRDRRDWHAHGDEHHHAESSHDNHIWLSPANAVTMVSHMTRWLIDLDSAHSTLYTKNSRALINRLETLDSQIGTDLKAVAERPYIVFHDAYQYFETHYGMLAVGTVTISPEQLSGARHVHHLRETIKKRGARCIFTEPQFEPKLVYTLVDGLGVKVGQLDPLGKELTPSPDCYFQLLRGLADNLLHCLSEEE